MTILDRLPTKRETVVGAASAAILSAGLGYAIWYVLRTALDRPEILTPGFVAFLVVISLIFAWSSALFLRIVFGSPKRASFKRQELFGYLAVAIGGAITLASLLFSTEHMLALLLQGVAAISIGLVWAYQARRSTRQ